MTLIERQRPTDDDIRGEWLEGENEFKVAP